MSVGSEVGPDDDSSRWVVCDGMSVSRLCSAAALIAFMAACSQATPPPPGGGGGGAGGTGGSGGTAATGGAGAADGTAGTGGTAASGGTGGSAGSAGIGGSGDGGAGGGRACLSPADIDAITALYPTSPRQLAAQCGESCAAQIGDQAFVDCVNPCVEAGMPGLSAGCASCYGDFTLCIRYTCLTQCALDACGLPCESCPGYDTCFQALSECAGRDSQDCGFN